MKENTTKKQYSVKIEILLWGTTTVFASSKKEAQRIILDRLHGIPQGRAHDAIDVIDTGRAFRPLVPLSQVELKNSSRR